MDASKYAYTGVLTQTQEETDHLITCKWIIQRITVKLGSTHKGGLCNLHVSEEA